MRYIAHALRTAGFVWLAWYMHSNGVPLDLATLAAIALAAVLLAISAAIDEERAAREARRSDRPVTLRRRNGLWVCDDPGVRITFDKESP